MTYQFLRSSEILRMSHRVIAMCEGRITGQMPIEEATQEKIMKFATQRNGKTPGVEAQQTPTQGGQA